MCRIHLFHAGLRTSLFSLETASVLSHSNLKIEMSLLGCMAVMAATSFGLFNCAVNIYFIYIYKYRCEIFSFLLHLFHVSSPNQRHSQLGDLMLCYGDNHSTNLCGPVCDAMATQNICLCQIFYSWIVHMAERKAVFCFYYSNKCDCR